MKQDPERTCVGCRVKRPRKELGRFTFNEGKLVFDKNYEYGGRGLYLCFNEKCVEKMVKKARLLKLYNISKRELEEFLTEFRSEVVTGCQAR
ncbi:MAG: YlxR family protein [Thermodesulfovibrionales bacterium]